MPLGNPLESAIWPDGTLLVLAQALRPKQWIKNAFVLAPLVFAGGIRDPGKAGRAVAAAALFCLASSAVYLLNDIADRDADRHHPRKRHRPIASGRLPVRTAAWTSGLLFFASMGGALSLGRGFAAVLGLYLVLNAAYSAGLKRVVILDVLLVAAGFVLRVEGGSRAIAVRSSDWLHLCTFVLALFLAATKRRCEVVQLGEQAPEARPALGRYSLPLLDQMITVALGATVMSYALYTIAPETVARLRDDFFHTVAYVVFGMFRYLHVTWQADGWDTPEEIVLRDRPLAVCILLWILDILVNVYVRPFPF